MFNCLSILFVLLFKLFTPTPFCSLNILLNERITTLYLNEGEFGEGFDGVPMLHRDDNGIACFYLLLLTIEHKDAFTLNEGPGFTPVVVDLIADILAFLKRDALGEGVSAIGIVAVIKHTIGTPTSLLIHWAWSEIFY